MTTTDYQSLRRSTNPVFHVFADTWDKGDPWGSAMAAGFAVCTVLDAVNASDRIDPGAGYSRGMAAPETLDDLADADEDSGTPYEDTMLATAVRSGQVTVDDLAAATRIISLYCDVLKAAGRDY